MHFRCTKEMMPILGSLMDFALSTPDHCRRLLLPSQVARDVRKRFLPRILTNLGWKIWKKRIIHVELHELFGLDFGVGGFFCNRLCFWAKRSVWSGLLGTVTKWKLATLSGSDAVNVAHSARSLVQTRTKQSVDSSHIIISYHFNSF